MYRGHFAKGKSPAHQALAEAIFKVSFAHTHAALTRLHLIGEHSHLTPQLFEATITQRDENIEDMQRALEQAGSESERQVIADWTLGVSGTATTLSLLCEQMRASNVAASWGTPRTVPTSVTGTPMRDSVIAEQMQPLDQTLRGLLDDFLSISLNTEDSSVADDAGEDEDDEDDDDDEQQVAFDIGMEMDNLDLPQTPAPSATAAQQSGGTSKKSKKSVPAHATLPGADWFAGLEMPPCNSAAHEAFYTLYFRIAGARALAFRLGHVKSNNLKDRVLLRKLQRFVAAHESCVKWATERANHVVSLEELERLYGQGCGPGNVYAPDRALIGVTRHEHVLRERPLQVLAREFPQAIWHPERVPHDLLKQMGPNPRVLQPQLAEGTGEVTFYGWAPFKGVSVDTHALYYGVVFVLNQCMRYLKLQRAPEVKYALWVYYVSWTELFAHCLAVKPQPRIDDAYLKLPRGSYMGRDGNPVYGEGASPWTLYGTCDTRTFCAGDLPDLYHVLVNIPLWGEQRTPPFFLGKLYQKVMPFAGQRRHIIKLAVKCTLDHPAFWKLFSKLAWVMLANLYPGDLAGPYDRLGMRSLLRIRELCENRDMLIGALMAQQPGMSKILSRPVVRETQDPFLAQVVQAAGTKSNSAGSNGGPLIVATMFRMHILYMGSFNRVYVDQARALIDWDYHKADAVRLAGIIRQHSLFAHDAFAQVRVELSKTVKSPHSHVHRIRRRSVAVMLREKMDDTLEKVILRNRQMFAKDASVLKSILKTPSASGLQGDVERFLKETKSGERAAADGVPPDSITLEVLQMALDCAQEAVAFYDRELNLPVKSAILNQLLHVYPEDRLTRPAFAGLLLKPECGGVAPVTVEIMWQLVQVARDKAAPKDFAKLIGAMEAHDFLVATFYFNMVAMLEKIHFVPLDADTVERTDDAMRNVRYEGVAQTTESMYEVAISLCCDRICTVTGQERYGNRRVSFDLEHRQLVCVHNKAAAAARTAKERAAARVAEAVALAEADAANGEEGEENEDNDDDDEDEEHAVLRQAQQEVADEEADREAFRELRGDLLGEATAMGGRGAKRTRVMQDRKVIRSQRKLFSKVPCGQPVLVVSLRGRALLWGNQLDKRIQLMFCPQCGALHTYTIFGWSALENPNQPGAYRCAECMRRELTHVVQRMCAYCGKNAQEDHVLDVSCLVRDTTYNGDPAFDPLTPSGRAALVQTLHFCESHYRIVSRLPKTLSKNDMWQAIRAIQESRAQKRMRNGPPQKWK